MFVDNVEIKIRAGKGGSGLASFRRGKFEPFGGPDGGDGGKGGDIFFLADSNVQDLSFFKHKTVFRAENGGKGGPNQMHGLNAAGLIIKVPVGTSIYAKDGTRVLLTADLQKDGQKVLIAKGGKGGKGNVHFATATRKAPKIFQPGEGGEQRDITLRMRLPIDVCILGYPNSGKSSLVAALSRARPEIAGYPFTTIVPALGVVDDGVQKYVWAEIPALMRESADGKGLGARYLSQAERASVIMYLLDAGSENLCDDLDYLKEEVALFDSGLDGKICAVVVNKIDLVEDDNQLRAVKERLAPANCPVFYISAKEKEGLGELVAGVHNLVKGVKEKMVGEVQPIKIFRPKPVDTRG